VKLDEPRIKATISNRNLIVRNLQVTLGYYRLSQGMRKVLGSRNVTWVGIATYASKTAGQAIRHELMPQRIKSALIRAAGYDETFMFLRDVLIEPAQDPVDETTNRLAEALSEVSLLVSEGNVMVYAELAEPFLEFIKRFSDVWSRDDAELNRFVSECLRSGAIEEGGQDWLIEAFRAFYDARFETDPKLKAEHVFHANMLVGLHEQTRLQPFIERALAVPVTVIGSSGTSTHSAVTDDKEKPGVTLKLAMKWGTRMLMSLTLPNRELRLAQDVIAPTGVVRFAPDLITLEQPRVIELVSSFNRDADTLSGSAADNWASLAERMGFIVDLFRSHQQYKRMFEPPFLEDQIAAIDSGFMPAGPL
jgi:hypothetical protein